MKNNKQIQICHLCGKSIKKPDLTREHVPPKNFFPKADELRKNLLTYPVHGSCNRDYQNEERIFAAAILGTAESQIGVKYRDMNITDMISYRTRRLGEVLASRKIIVPTKEFFYGEFTAINNARRMSVIDDNLIGIPVNRAVFEKVVWKITKGLYFHTEKQCLSDNALKMIHGPHDVWRNPGKMDVFFVQHNERRSQPDFIESPEEKKIEFHYMETDCNPNPSCFHYNYCSWLSTDKGVIERRYIFNMIFLDSISASAFFGVRICNDQE